MTAPIRRDNSNSRKNSIVPEIFVINLVSSAARRANITSQLADLGLAFTLFPAVDGRKEDHRLFGKYDNERNRHYRGQALSRGQLGWYASHYLLWQKCVELDHPIVVLEDDGRVPSGTLFRVREQHGRIAPSVRLRSPFQQQAKDIFVLPGIASRYR